MWGPGEHPPTHRRRRAPPIYVQRWRRGWASAHPRSGSGAPPSTNSRGGAQAAARLRPMSPARSHRCLDLREVASNRRKRPHRRHPRYRTRFQQPAPTVARLGRRGTGVAALGLEPPVSPLEERRRGRRYARVEPSGWRRLSQLSYLKRNHETSTKLLGYVKNLPRMNCRVLDFQSRSA
jgi:hypothetical protein